MLLPSWSAPVVAGHPLLRWIHTVDHWKISRRPGGFATRLRDYARSRRKAVSEIRSVGYDAAVDLYPYYPNNVDLLWQAGIERRFGYRSGGGGPMLTHAIEWRHSRAHTARQHLDLLGELDPSFSSGTGDQALRYSLPEIPADAHARANDVLEAAGISPQGFVVLHPGVGMPLKAWPAERWVALGKQLSLRGATVVVTGAGEQECGVANQIASSAGAVSLCGQLDWLAFRSVLSRAALVVGSDSVAAHLAAAERTPCVTIMAGMSDPEHWKPLGDRVHVVTHGVQCSPCFRSNGCAAMSCIREVTVNDVIVAVDSVVGPRDGLVETPRPGGRG
jgi:ADP-heptose:LPS heptosyltransferase